jgi:hypothetical protein
MCDTFPSSSKFKVLIDAQLQVQPQSPQACTQRPTGLCPTAYCRGCNKSIQGGSLRSIDGRLSGRWHRHCFTCRVCNQPSTLLDCYILNDDPYCAQHYHEVNGTACSLCKQGIEGQCLERAKLDSNEAVGRKYHPRCFNTLYA